MKKERGKLFSQKNLLITAITIIVLLFALTYFLPSFSDKNSNEISNEGSLYTIIPGEGITCTPPHEGSIDNGGCPPCLRCTPDAAGSLGKWYCRVPSNNNPPTGNKCQSTDGKEGLCSGGECKECNCASGDSKICQSCILKNGEPYCVNTNNDERCNSNGGTNNGICSGGKCNKCPSCNFECQTCVMDFNSNNYVTKCIPKTTCSQIGSCRGVYC